MVGQPRSTQRLAPPVPSDDELALRAWLRDFSRRRPRWGWRRAAVEAKKAGFRANHKRIHRLWIAEGLRVPYRKRKKPLRGIGRPVGAMCPIRPNVVWAMDFQFDQTSDGKMLKILNVVDELTREALACDVERSIDADGVVRCLERLAAGRGAPVYVRFDNGPEYAAHAVADWCRFNGAGTVFIDPRSDWPVNPGRTPGSRASTAGCATSTSTASSSTASSKPRSSVRGHEKVPGYGHEKSPVVATGSPRWWPAEVPTPR